MNFFYEDIQKKEINYLDVTQKMRQFLKEEQPKLTQILTRFWQAQSNVITYRELKRAVIEGMMTEEIFQQWNEDYAHLFNTYFLPKWLLAVEETATELKRRYPLYSYNPAGDAAVQWAESHAAEFVARMTDQQRKAINTMIRYAGTTEQMTVEQLARHIRPLVGLTEPQTVANMNYYGTLRENKVPHRQAAKKCASYGAKQHRYRAQNIACNELAVFYRAGMRLGIEDAQAKGFMGRTRKRWISARDKRVCKTCKALDGVEKDFNDPFITRKDPEGNDLDGDTYGAHISCRCIIVYFEVEPPETLS